MYVCMYVCMCVCVCVCVCVRMHVTPAATPVTALHLSPPHISHATLTQAAVYRNILFTPRNELIIKFHQPEPVHKILHIPRIFCEGKFCPFLFKLTSNVEMRGAGRIHSSSASLWQAGRWFVVQSNLRSDCAVRYGHTRVSEHHTATLFRAEVNASNLALHCFREETGFDCVQASCKEMWPFRETGTGGAATVCCGIAQTVERRRLELSAVKRHSSRFVE